MTRLALWCVLAAAALCGRCASARDYQVFDVVGDSISAGVNPGCGELYGWVDMLFGESGCASPAPANTITGLWPGIAVYNSAISGSTAKQWAWQQPSYLAVVSNHHPDLVVVFIGGNDGLAYAADGVYTAAEKEEFRTNLITIIQRLRNNTPIPDIIVANYYDLFDGLSTNLSFPYEAYRGLSAVTVEGNAVIEGIAASNGCFFADVYSSFLHHSYGSSLGDTQHLSPDYVRTPISSFDIHPVTAGHGSIRDVMYERLGELKEIPRVLDIRASAGTFTVGWRSSIGQQYIIERADAPSGPYAPLATNAGCPPCNVFTDSVPGVSRAFYRALVP